MKIPCAPFFDSRRSGHSFQVAFRLLLVAVVAHSAGVAAASVVAYSNFGPGDTYGNFGDTIGGQFVSGYQFTSAAAGRVTEIGVGIGGSGTFDLELFTDNAGTLGISIWSETGIPVGSGSPNPAHVDVDSGPLLGINQKYWLVASGPAASAFWSPNTTNAFGSRYYRDSSTQFYTQNTRLGAFRVMVTPEPGTTTLLWMGGLALLYRRPRAKKVEGV